MCIFVHVTMRECEYNTRVFTVYLFNSWQPIQLFEVLVQKQIQVVIYFDTNPVEIPNRKARSFDLRLNLNLTSVRNS